MFFSVAPMMDWTDRHDRYFLRLLAPNAVLYTEMITAQALCFGDAARLLQHHRAEHPLVLQLGGSCRRQLAEAVKHALPYDFSAINLNVGCPSARVQSGEFGACLMKTPKRVAECVRSMREQTDLPVTVKCRIGVDDHDSYAHLANFINEMNEAGCKQVIIHARKAWLSGLSPKQNREIPPLCYSMVYDIKRDFPELHVTINGGISELSAAVEHLRYVDQVMIGRAAYHNPYFLAELQHYFYPERPMADRGMVAQQYAVYARTMLAEGVRLSSLVRHTLGLFHGQAGAKVWRRFLTEGLRDSNANESIFGQALEAVGSIC